MTDRHPTELLSAYLDDEVTAAERHEVARHLEACGECRALLDDFRTMAEAAAAEPPPPIPAGMAARIVSALEGPARQRRLFVWPFPLPLAAAAGLLVIFAGAWVILRRGMERPPVVVSQARPESPVPGQSVAEDAIVPRERELVRAPESGAAQPARPDTGGARAQRAAPAGKVDQDARGLIDNAGRRNQQARTDRPSAAPAPSARDFAPAPDARAPDAPPSAAAGALEALPPPPPPPPSAAVAGEEPKASTAFRAAEIRMDGRSLVFRFEGEEGTLWESGRVMLVWKQGACSVDLSADAAVLEEVRSIFRLASTPPTSRTRQRAERTAPEAAARPDVKTLAEGDTRSPVRLLRLLSHASQPIDISEAAAVEERLRRLLERDGRAAIEAGCGSP